MTLQHVAALAEVTKVTVSRFLREPAVVAETTAARIREAIAQTGYVPNRQAGQLASGRSRIVAALLPNLAHSIFAETVQGLADRLQEGGHELMLASTGYSIEREEDQLRAVLGWAPAGIVVTGRRHTQATLELMRQARAAGTPMVEIWDYHPEAMVADGVAQVGFDHAEVGRAMAQHLLGLGHQRLMYVDSGVAEDFRAHERGAAFAAAVKVAGARARIVRAIGGDAFDAGRQIVANLHAKGQSRVTALAFANDQLACGALLEARATGLNVPGDLALLGFGDFPIGRQLSPPLSTVRPPRYEIGHAAAAALLHALATGEQIPNRKLEWELIARGSTAAAPVNRPRSSRR